jgi:hypothetical protein
MPDGRVWFAGSNKRCDWSFHNSADFGGMPEPTTLQEVTATGPVDNRELRIEIFEPWYFSRPDRPTLTLDASSVGIGRQFKLESPQAASLSRVALMRAGSCTHAFNSDQRYIGLPFTVSGTTVTATLPDNENILPPGPYLVFVLVQVLDPSGATLDVPSVGQWIEVVNSKLIKELKMEVEHFKLEIELLNKENEVFDPFQQYQGDPAILLQSIAVAVDNIARGAGSARSFITGNERPLLAQVTQGQLAAVAIHPIDPLVLQRQLSMEGMMSLTQKPVSPSPMENEMPAKSPIVKKGGKKSVKKR